MMPAVDREELLLTLLAKMERVYGKTRIQKLIFIIEASAATPGSSVPFQYHLYKHGPFSLDVAFTLDALRDKQDVTETFKRTQSDRPVYLFTITDSGRARAREPIAVPEPWRHAVDEVVSKYSTLDLPQLVEEAYVHAKKRPELVRPGPPGVS